MKLLYSLLITFLITTSLFSNVSCKPSDKVLVYLSEIEGHEVTHCGSDGSSYSTCASDDARHEITTTSNSFLSHAPDGQCNEDYDFSRVQSSITYTWYDTCPDDLIPDVEGICVPPPPPTCTINEYLDTNNICQPNPTCNIDQYLDKTTNPPICKSNPTCGLNEILNTTTNPPTCDPISCPAGTALLNGKCETDSDGDGDPDITDPYPNDPTRSGNSPTDTTCKGQDLSVSPTITGSSFAINSYKFQGDSYPDDCKYYATGNPSVWDGSLSYPDLNPLCLYVWCRVHEVSNTCTYSASDRQPTGYIYNSSATSENSCASLVDGVKYTSKIWDVPNSLSCPKTAYCFLKLAPTTSNTSPDSNTTNNSIDLNTTSANNMALLDSSNTTNKHLDDLKKKADITNENLNDIKETNNKILTSSKDINNNLSDLNSKMDKSNSNSILMNTSLSNMNKALLDSNNNLKSLSSTLLANNAKMNSLNLNQMETTSAVNKVDETLNEGLFGEDPFEEINDGLDDNIGGIETTIKGSFSGFIQTSIFPFTTASYSIPTYNMNLSYGSYEIFSASTLNILPLSELRALILFVFSLAGFITVFKTT